MIRINEDLEIAESELTFTASRSGGPGGQNVNKVNTRVTLSFDVTGSPSLSEAQKARIRQRLSRRMNRQGVLRTVCQRHRTREANRRGAVARFSELLAEALQTTSTRRRTTVSAKSRAERLREKRRRSERKRSRSDSPDPWED